MISGSNPVDGLDRGWMFAALERALAAIGLRRKRQKVESTSVGPVSTSSQQPAEADTGRETPTES
jgi:hypothetical protein